MKGNSVIGLAHLYVLFLRASSDASVSVAWAVARVAGLEGILVGPAGAGPGHLTVLSSLRPAPGSGAGGSLLGSAPALSRPVSRVSHVMTGGYGAVASLSVQWLLATGPCDVVLLGRSGRSVALPSMLPQRSLDLSSASLGTGGRSVLTAARCDVATRSEAGAVLPSASRHCAVSVFHAGGVLLDAVLGESRPGLLASDCVSLGR